MWQYNYTNNYLCHWGIKGMRWGVRRYQNKDGTLTPLGKQRLQSKIDSSKRRFSKDSYKQNAESYRRELSKIQREGYKKWAKDNYLDDYTDSDKRKEFEEYLSEVKRKIKVEEFFSDRVDLLYSELDSLTQDSRYYKESMQKVNRYVNDWLSKTIYDLQEY